MKLVSTWLLCALAAGASASAEAADALRIGSKRFTESYILGEVLVQTARTHGAPQATHAQGLGNTAILLGALESGSIDLYPEYTGTIAREILRLDSVPPLDEMNALLAPRGLAVAVPLGFNNTYALAMRADEARARGITRISDLKAQAGLKFGLSQEFLGRADGWPNLAQRYGFGFAPPRGLDHGLAYEAIAGGQVDVIDIYSTDAKLDKYGLVVLADDLDYFPRYDAVLLYRAGVPVRFPEVWAAFRQLEGRLSDTAMARLNARAEIDRLDFAAVAAEWLNQQARLSSTAAPVAPADAGGSAGSAASEPGLMQRLFAADFGRLLLEHLALVFVSLVASVLIGVPLGVMAARRNAVAPAIFGVTGVIQTVPSLALLAILIPLTGRIGAVPAYIALTLYALLPIVRNTHAGLTQIPRATIEAARALGLRPRTILRRIELPLAMQTLLAGVKTSAVINVGTATIAAFIGAGGFGERIVTGLALNDQSALLAGALPVAVLALAVQALFEQIEKLAVPAGLRLPAR